MTFHRKFPTNLQSPSPSTDMHVVWKTACRGIRQHYGAYPSSHPPTIYDVVVWRRTISRWRVSLLSESKPNMKRKNISWDSNTSSYIQMLSPTFGCILSPADTNSAFPRPARATPLISDVEAPSPIPKANTLKNAIIYIIGWMPASPTNHFYFLWRDSPCASLSPRYLLWLRLRFEFCLKFVTDPYRWISLDPPQDMVEWTCKIIKISNVSPSVVGMLFHGIDDCLGIGDCPVG